MNIQRIFLFAVDPIMGAVGALAVLMIFFATLQGHEAAQRKRTYFVVEVALPTSASTTTAKEGVGFAFVRATGGGEQLVGPQDLGDEGRACVGATSSAGVTTVRLYVTNARSGTWTLKLLSRAWGFTGAGSMRLLTSSSPAVELPAEFPGSLGHYVTFRTPEGSTDERLAFTVEPGDAPEAP